MHSVWRGFLCAVFISLFAACTGAPKREPQSTLPSYNSERVRLLRLAAENGVLFSIPDSVLRDVPVYSAGDRCRKFSEGPWLEKVYGVMSVFERQPQLLGKIHVIEFRRGDRAGVELSKDLVDNAVTLTVSYAKVVRTQTIETLSDIPCPDGDMSLLKKDVTHTDFEWPDARSIAAALAAAEDRPKVERYDFDRRFLIWLAERMTILRLTPELAFERSPNGQPLIALMLGRLSEDLAQHGAPPSLEYWLKEISERSRMGAGLKFFSVVRDRQLSTGLSVESAGKFARRMNGYSDPTAPFISYKVENGGYVMADLPQLETCLARLTSTYRSPLSSMSNYDMDRDSFMFPGHSCPGE